MQTKKEQWLEAWDSETNRSNLVQTISVLLQRYSEATLEGERYTTNFFTKSYHTKSHIIPVNNTLNKTGYNHPIYSYREEIPLIKNLLSILKAEIGDTKISEEGDLWTILEVIKEKTGVDYNAIPAFNPLSKNEVGRKEIIKEVKPEVKIIPKKSKEDIQGELIQAVKQFSQDLKSIPKTTLFATDTGYSFAIHPYYKLLNAITHSTSIEEKIENFSKLKQHHTEATSLSSDFYFADLSNIMEAIDQLKTYEEEETHSNSMGNKL